MEEFFKFSRQLATHDFPILWFLINSFVVVAIIAAIVVYIYDRFIQRENQILINYPLIGHLRYFFYALRDPMRQYFGDEKFFDSFDKVKWVYNAATNKSPYASFSPEQPVKGAKIALKNANCVLNTEDVSDDFSVTFGSKNCPNKFRSKSIVGRSAMSDGAISPEGTRAFAKGAYLGGFPINTGEGGLTSNFLYTHRFKKENDKYLEVVEGTFFAKAVYRIVSFFINPSVAKRVYKHLILDDDIADTYLFDNMICYRVNWKAPLVEFPQTVPDDLPDIILQIGSGLYGVRDEKGEFDPIRYQKVMSFCKMTEIKMAQGAKQTGGKLLAEKVTPAIAYYRGVEPYKNLFSPNQFPYAKTLEELFDFIGKLKELSKKPVGVKIVISSKESFVEYAKLIKERVESNSDAYPDFISIDGGDGGSGAAPLEMMMSIGMAIQKAVFIADDVLKEFGVRNYVKIIASEKVLTPDDVVILKAIGADYIAIARAFMMSAGCIRARECSGANGRACPVGLATQDPKKRASYLVEQKARHVASYHDQLLHGVRQLLAVMGKRSVNELDQKDLLFKDPYGKTYNNLSRFFEDSIV